MVGSVVCQYSRKERVMFDSTLLELSSDIKCEDT